ncbi:MAG: hypothetical protein AAF599_08550, partial [Bacteroidota bacterium]
MKLSSIFFFSVLLFISATCNQEVEIDNITDAPEVTPADEKYANVYQPLDGKWKGTFKIFEDQNRKKVGEVDLQNISIANIKKPSLKMVNSIEVEQTYESQSPYFQKVWITDTYEENGTTKVVESKGVNKVQNGEMWCVVHKPNETVIHEGSTEGKSTIIWQSNQKEPQKIEYFRETVEANTYEIIGYGYYQGDDAKLSPKLWFY